MVGNDNDNHSILFYTYLYLLYLLLFISYFISYFYYFNHRDVNKKTIARYCEASLWQPLFNGVPISTAIARTAEWRSTDNIPVHDLGILEKGLASGE